MTRKQDVFSIDTDRPHTRFLDAGNNETLRTLSEPASKKRQGTKSREVGHWPGSERYGDLMSVPGSMIGVTLAGFDLRCD